jgi:hypothetical protein
MCEWNRQDGVTISLQHIWSTLAFAKLINRTFIMAPLPASAIMGAANEFLPFGDLFDINVLRRAYGPSCCVTPSEVPESARNYTRSDGNYLGLLAEFSGDKSKLIAHKHIRVCGVTFDFVQRANITSVYENTQPHPTLKKIIHLGWYQLQDAQTADTNSPSFKKPVVICIHLRTEPEFMHFFRHSPATYTREQIFIKMNLTREKHPNTSFAKLWLQNENHGVKPVLYLAGGNTSDSKQFFKATGWFSKVEDKDSIFINSRSTITSLDELLKRYHTPSSLLRALRFQISTVLAIIDLGICKKADIFIGNNHSSLSERIATERQRSNRWEGNANRTYENGGEYNYMVNALGKDADSWKDLSKLEPLHPFCAANAPIFLSYTCNYVRAPQK